MLKFECPSCGAPLMIGHPDVNPVRPTPPFSHWRALPRGWLDHQALADVPAGVDEVMDATGCYWRRGEGDVWSQIRAEDLREFLPSMSRDIHARPPYHYRVGAMAFDVLHPRCRATIDGERFGIAHTVAEIPAAVLEVRDDRKIWWARAAGGQPWFMRISQIGRPPFTWRTLEAHGTEKCDSIEDVPQWVTDIEDADGRWFGRESAGEAWGETRRAKP